MPTDPTTTVAPNLKPAPPALGAPAQSNGTAAPIAKQTSLDRWLSDKGAVLTSESKVRTSRTLSAYMVDNVEFFVLRWANGQGWKILGDMGSIKQAGEFLFGDEG